MGAVLIRVFCFSVAFDWPTMDRPTMDIWKLNTTVNHNNKKREFDFNKINQIQFYILLKILTTIKHDNNTPTIQYHLELKHNHCLFAKRNSFISTLLCVVHFTIKFIIKLKTTKFKCLNQNCFKPKFNLIK